MLPHSRWVTAGDPLWAFLFPEVDDGRQSSPVTAAPRDQVEVRRPPVLDQRRATVPPHPAIELLQISPALGARRDEIPLIPGLRLEAAKTLAVGIAAERAPDPRRCPAGPTDMAGEAAPAVLDDIAEARRRSAKRADPELPHAIGQVLAGYDEERVE